MDVVESCFNLWIPSPVQRLKFAGPDLDLYIKRDDLIHSVISGNKYRKLKHNLKEFFENHFKSVVLFGGPYSNLLHSFAVIADRLDIDTTFYIRGDDEGNINPTLNFIKKTKVKLEFLSRSEFRKIRESKFQNLPYHIDNSTFIIPEGASNQFAIPGAAEIIYELYKQLNFVPDYILADMGTGGTFAGLMSAINKQTKLVGIPVLKGVKWEKTLEEIFGNNEFKSKSNWQIIEDFHFGGFAKFDKRLIEFINDFKIKYGIPLDPIYTGKLFYAFFYLLENRFFTPNSKVVILHSGGLQGIEGFNKINNNILI